MIYKPFEIWGHWECPHKSPSPCNTYVIPMSLYKFVSSYVTKNKHTQMYTYIVSFTCLCSDFLCAIVKLVLHNLSDWFTLSSAFSFLSESFLLKYFISMFEMSEVISLNLNISQLVWHHFLSSTWSHLYSHFLVYTDVPSVNFPHFPF